MSYHLSQLRVPGKEPCHLSRQWRFFIRGDFARMHVRLSAMPNQPSGNRLSTQSQNHQAAADESLNDRPEKPQQRPGTEPDEYEKRHKRVEHQQRPAHSF